MTDQQIVDLYWQRDESALRLTAACYGAMLAAVARRILDDPAESEETVNDTYLKAWNVIPPHKPAKLGAFLAKITRELAIDRYRRRRAEKRTASQYALSLEELSECVPGGETVEEAADAKALSEYLDGFIRSLPAEKRFVFIRRYWYGDGISDIAKKAKVNETRVKNILSRLRKKLREELEKEGFFG